MFTTFAVVIDLVKLPHCIINIGIEIKVTNYNLIPDRNEVTDVHVARSLTPEGVEERSYREYIQESMGKGL